MKDVERIAPSFAWGTTKQRVMHAGLLLWCMYLRLVCRCTQTPNQAYREILSASPVSVAYTSLVFVWEFWVLSGRNSGRANVYVVVVTCVWWMFHSGCGCCGIYVASLYQYDRCASLQIYSLPPSYSAESFLFYFIYIIADITYLFSVHALLTWLLSDPERFLTPFFPGVVR